MNYYEVALLSSSAPILTYSSKEDIELGCVVDIPLKSSIKKGAILAKVKEPTFKTSEIVSANNLYYKKWQLEVANFIKDYYFSSIGEALGLFVPFSKEPTSSHKANIKDLPKLTTLQEDVYKQISKQDISLLFGVTGSGKTEVYIHLIADILKENKNAILLMPEIALTPQITKRLEKVFGNCVATWHSKITKKKRLETIDKIYSGEVKVVIGARSALFLPMSNLGIIVVDEEHDDSYKAHSRPRYNAKDLSVYIGKKLNIKVLLGSATPLVSSYKKYPIVRLKKPYKEAKKEFKFILGEEINHHILKEINQRVQQSEQALIFVPTRANFKYLVCSSCGKAQTCPYCSIGMSIHTKRRYLQCHYCSYTQKIPNSCVHCQQEALTSQRVGTAEVVDLINSEIKDSKVEQFDKDTITTANKLHKALLRVQNKESNIIVGTQMLSKGHDYPEITLSVITGLDYTVAMGDYRAKERAIALLHQIAGRSGRSKDALILIQTSQPDFFIPYLKDYEEFIKEELLFREPIYPPFSNLARVLIANKDYQKAQQIMQEALNSLQLIKDIEVVGAGTAPIERISNKWRFNILLRSNKKVSLLKALHLINNQNLEIDIDPVDFS
jgi:primosomal protein N' (replication factor Y)